MRDAAYMTVRQLRNELATLRAKVERVTKERQFFLECHTREVMLRNEAEAKVAALTAQLAAERERIAGIGLPVPPRLSDEQAEGWMEAVTCYRKLIRALPAPEAT